jgi:hypothetical protein
MESPLSTKRDAQSVRVTVGRLYLRLQGHPINVFGHKAAKCIREECGRIPRSRLLHRQLRIRLITELAVLGVVLLLVLSPVLSSHGFPLQSGSLASLTMAEAGPQAGTNSGYAVPTNLSYCGLLGPDPGTSAGLPNYTQNVSILWNKTCVLPSFMQAINRWGNLYLAYTGGTNNSTYWASGNLTVESGGGHRIPSVQFGVVFSAPCTNVTGGNGVDCSYDTYWSGNVSTNEVTGPFTSELLCPGCRFIVPGLTGPPASPGVPYWLVLAFSLTGAFGLGVALAARRGGAPPKNPQTPVPSGSASGTSAMATLREPTKTPPTDSTGHGPSESRGGDLLEDMF